MLFLYQGYYKTLLYNYKQIHVLHYCLQICCLINLCSVISLTPFRSLRVIFAFDEKGYDDNFLLYYLIFELYENGGRYPFLIFKEKVGFGPTTSRFHNDFLI